MVTINSLAAYADDNGNQIIGSVLSESGIKVNFGAKNCKIVIADGCKFNRATFTMEADGGEVYIGNNCQLNGVSFRVGHNTKITLKKNIYTTSSAHFSAAEGADVVVGSGCIIAEGVAIRSDHSHPIWDRTTLKRTNPSRRVTIGDHVWLAPQVFVFPGANIGEGCVIGLRSIVTGKISPNSIAAGSPAKVVRRNIVWDRAHLAARKPWNFESPENIKLWNSKFPPDIAMDSRNQSLFYKIKRTIPSPIKRWIKSILPKK